MANNRLFVTGTDTGIGKTVITTALLYQLQQWGYTTVGCKPISSGCSNTEDGLRNDDALQLQQAANYSLKYEDVNPIAFSEYIAPVIAAQHEKKPMCLTQVSNLLKPAFAAPVDYVVLEGAGGWLQPLNTQHTLADYVIQSGMPVVLVVGLRLGCVNHSLLTWSHLQSNRVPVLGWVANCIDPTMQAQHDNIVLLSELIAVPCLGVIDHHAKPISTTVASQFNQAVLIQQLNRYSMSSSSSSRLSSSTSSSSKLANVS